MNTETNATTYVGADQSEIDARRAMTKLRNLLRLNTGFSIGTGAVGVVAAAPVSGFLGVEQAWAVALLGVFLLGFAVSVFMVSGSTTKTLLRLSQFISFSDFGWAVGTVAVIGLGWLSTGGAVVMGALGLVVLALGASQVRARRQGIASLAQTGADLEEFPPVEILYISRTSAKTAQELWPVMTDHGLYAKLALNLSAAQGLTPNGPGFERTCTDTRNRTWSESCTRWDEGRRFDVNANISEYPYPLQLVQGSWEVTPTEAPGSVIGATFAIRPRLGLYGRLFVPAMHLVFRPLLRRITRGWAKASNDLK